jgi:hypothetical protein
LLELIECCGMQDTSINKKLRCSLSHAVRGLDRGWLCNCQYGDRESKNTEEIVCCERGSSKFGAPRGFIEDGGRPPEVGLQGQISNHHKLQG